MKLLPNGQKSGVKVIDPQKGKKVPDGCIEVWQIQSMTNGRCRYHGIFKDFEVGMAHAVSFNDAPEFVGASFSLCHKAAVALSTGKYHLVHFNPIRFQEPDPQVLAAMADAANVIANLPAPTADDSAPY